MNSPNTLHSGQTPTGAPNTMLTQTYLQETSDCSNNNSVNSKNYTSNINSSYNDNSNSNNSNSCSNITTVNNNINKCDGGELERERKRKRLPMEEMSCSRTTRQKQQQQQQQHHVGVIAVTGGDSTITKKAKVNELTSSQKFNFDNNNSNRILLHPKDDCEVENTGLAGNDALSRGPVDQLSPHDIGENKRKHHDNNNLSRNSISGGTNGHVKLETKADNSEINVRQATAAEEPEKEVFEKEGTETRHKLLKLEEKIRSERLLRSETAPRQNTYIPIVRVANTRSSTKHAKDNSANYVTNIEEDKNFDDSGDINVIDVKRSAAKRSYLPLQQTSECASITPLTAAENVNGSDVLPLIRLVRIENQYQNQHFEQEQLAHTNERINLSTVSTDDDNDSCDVIQAQKPKTEPGYNTQSMGDIESDDAVGREEEFDKLEGNVNDGDANIVAINISGNERAEDSGDDNESSEAGISEKCRANGNYIKDCEDNADNCKGLVSNHSNTNLKLNLNHGCNNYQNESGSENEPIGESHQIEHRQLDDDERDDDHDSKNVVASIAGGGEVLRQIHTPIDEIQNQSNKDFDVCSGTDLHIGKSEIVQFNNNNNNRGCTNLKQEIAVQDNEQAIVTPTQSCDKHMKSLMSPTPPHTIGNCNQGCGDKTKHDHINDDMRENEDETIAHNTAQTDTDAADNNESNIRTTDNEAPEYTAPVLNSWDTTQTPVDDYASYVTNNECTGTVHSGTELRDIRSLDSQGTPNGLCYPQPISTNHSSETASPHAKAVVGLSADLDQQQQQPLLATTAGHAQNICEGTVLHGTARTQDNYDMQHQQQLLTREMEVRQQLYMGATSTQIEERQLHYHQKSQHIQQTEQLLHLQQQPEQLLHLQHQQHDLNKQQKHLQNEQQQQHSMMQSEMQHYMQSQMMQLHQQQHHHLPQQQQHVPQSLHHLSSGHQHMSHTQIPNIHQQQHLTQNEQQHHLMTYLHHQQQQPQRQLELYNQQHQQYSQQPTHQQHQKHLSTELLLTTQHQHPLKHSGAGLKRLNPHQPPGNIDDLIIDDFPEDPNAAYKLGLSPGNIKHENQDDGYETSAGDVLTPNSHSSSTHSVTSQHQLQHAMSLIPPSKCEEQHQMQQQQHQASNTEVMQQRQTTKQQQQLSHELQNASPSAANFPTDSYTFMNEEMTANSNVSNNINSTAIAVPSELGHNNSADLNNMSNGNNRSYMGSVTGNTELYTLQQHQQNQHMQQLQHHHLHETVNEMSTQDYINKHEFSATMLSNDPADQCRQQHHQQQQPPTQQDLTFSSISSDVTDLLKPPQKKRGRKKKIQMAPDSTTNLISINGSNISNLTSNNAIQTGFSDVSHELTTVDEETTSGRTSMPLGNGGNQGQLKCKERKKHDRFNGMSEEEVVKRTLPDHLCDNLDIVIIGINPGLFAAYKGHHYAGPGNHFWKCLYLSGLTQEQMCAEQDYKLIKFGIGFTNMVQRATKGSADLTRKEIKEGSRVLLEKLKRFRPKIAVFNGKLIFEVFSGKKDFNFGRQPECVEGTDTYIWVMPSSSARCAQLPRAADKVPFYAALKKFRDYLNGLIPHIDDSECVFTEQKIKQVCEQENRKNLNAMAAANVTSAVITPTNGGNTSTAETAGLIYNNLVNMHNMENTTNANTTRDSNASLQHASVVESATVIDADSPLQNENSMIQQSKYTQFQNSAPTGTNYIYGPDESLHARIMVNQAPGPGPGPPPPQRTGVPSAGQMLISGGGNSSPLLPGQPGVDGSYMLSTFRGQQLPEKKKRGRPKKIKDPEIMDSVARSRMQLNSQISDSNDFRNILNLSMLGSTNGAAGVGCSNDAMLAMGHGLGNSGETPKKKRGRPKKVKPTNDAQNPHMSNTKAHIMSIQALTSLDHNCTSPQRVQHQQNQQQQVQQHQHQHVIYGTPSLSQQQLYGTDDTVSPMRSPVLNRNYVGVTPPPSQLKPPQQSDKSLDKNPMESPTQQHPQLDVSTNSGYFATKSTDLVTASNSNTPPAPTSAEVASSIVNGLSREGTAVESGDPHLGESPPPSSPNICTVDFEPPTGNTASLVSEAEKEIQHQQQQRQEQQQQEQLSLQQQQQTSRYSSPVHVSAIVPAAIEHQPTDHYHQWLSPQHHSPHAATVALSPHFMHHQQQHLQPTHLEHHHALTFEEQQQQHHMHQMQHAVMNSHEHTQAGTNAATALHMQWQRHQRYISNPYAIVSPQGNPNHHHQQQHQHASAHQHLTNLSTDVSSKSLSGLESLVDQIPSMTESDSTLPTVVPTSNSTTNPHIESRQQQHHQHHQSEIQHLRGMELTSSDQYRNTPTNATPNGASDKVIETSATGNNSSGSNTPHTVTDIFSANSPNNFSIHRLNSTTLATSSPSLMSPHQHHQQISQQHSQYGRNSGTPQMSEILPSGTPLTNANSHRNSPADASTNNSEDTTTNVCTPPASSVSAAAVSNSMYNISSIHHTTTSNLNSNFSVSNLAASSVTSSSNCDGNIFGSLSTSSSHPISNAYHHSNLMAAAALAVAAAASTPANHLTSSPTTGTAAAAVAAAHAHHVAHPQMYMDPHSHISPVNPMYAPTTTHHPHAHPHAHAQTHPHAHAHHTAHHSAHHPTHHPTHHHHHAAYGSPTSVQHANVGSDYASSYAGAATPPAALHLPSPNYPYGYGGPVPQSSFGSGMHSTHQSATAVAAAGAPPGAVSAAAAAAAAAAAGVYHPHPSHQHATHPLSVFDRLKPTDITGYSGF